MPILSAALVLMAARPSFAEPPSVATVSAAAPSALRSPPPESGVSRSSPAPNVSSLVARARSPRSGRTVKIRIANELATYPPALESPDAAETVALYSSIPAARLEAIRRLQMHSDALMSVAGAALYPSTRQSALHLIEESVRSALLAGVPLTEQELTCFAYERTLDAELRTQIFMAMRTQRFRCSFES